jgi:hypothetical protein
MAPPNLVPAYHSVSTINSQQSDNYGQHESFFGFNAMPSTATADALISEYNNHDNTNGFVDFSNTIGATMPPSPPIPTRGIFAAMFPIWGNIILDAVVAVSLSLVYFNPAYRWIANQVQGTVHALCYLVYRAINFVLEAHSIDFPHSPPEHGTLPP